VEGDSASALRTAMVCQQYAKDITLVEQTMVSTFNLLLEFDKLEDCERLVDPSISMLL
jgi:deoxyhypusine synthase